MASAAQLLVAAPLAAVALKRRRELEAKRKTTAATPPMRLLEYIRQAWSVVEPSAAFVPGFHIEAIAEHLEAVARGDIQDLVITVPPRTAKSLCCSVFLPTWMWTFAPHTRWLTNSYAQSLSVRDALRSRRLIESTWYQRQWSHVFALAGDQDTKSRYDNTRGGYRIAASVGGSNTGEGGDWLICDDAHNVIDAESALVREATVRWWFEVMTSRRNDPRTSKRIVIQQRVHEADLVGEILRQANYHWLNLPMEYVPTTMVAGCELAHDWRTDEGELLWPERYIQADVADLKKTLGPYSWSGQYQQDPVPRSGAILDAGWFAPIPSDWRRADLPIVQYWDLAFSEKEMADYTVACTLVMDDEKLYLTSVFRERVSELNLAEAIADHITATQPNLVGIEESASKATAVRQLVQQVRQLAGEWAGHGRVMGVPVSRDKIMRSQVAAGQGQAGNLLADRTAPWWTTFASELAAFPLGAHDDQVDALSGAVTLAVEHLRKQQALDMLLSQPVTVRHVSGAVTGGWHPHRSPERPDVRA
jgi:predicted phage terminase large subunit-like protein